MAFRQLRLNPLRFPASESKQSFADLLPPGDLLLASEIRQVIS